MQCNAMHCLALCRVSFAVATGFCVLVSILTSTPVCTIGIRYELLRKKKAQKAMEVKTKKKSKGRVVHREAKSAARAAASSETKNGGE